MTRQTGRRRGRAGQAREGGVVPLAQEVHEIALHRARVLELVDEQHVDRAADRRADRRIVPQAVAGGAQEIAEPEAALGAADRREPLADLLQQLDDPRLAAGQRRGLAEEAEQLLRLVAGGSRPAAPRGRR